MVIEEASCLKASQRAHRAHVTCQQNKSTHLITSENLTQSEITTLELSFEDLKRKKAIPDDLDENIAEKIEDQDELETDIFTAEELRSNIQGSIQHSPAVIDQIVHFDDKSMNLHRITKLTKLNNPRHGATQNF